MSDDQLKVLMSEATPGSYDYIAAKRVLDDRALSKRERRTDRFVIAGLVIATLLAVATIAAVR